MSQDELEDFEESFNFQPPPDMEPSLTDILPRGYLSVSQAKQYLKCPHAWELQYIEGHRGKMSARLYQGVQGHSTAEAVLNERLMKGTVPPVEFATDTFATEFDAGKDRVQNWEDTDPGVVKDLGIQCVTMFMNTAAAEATPVAVEKTFATTVKGKGGFDVPVLGRIDSVQVECASEQEYQDVREKVVAAMPPDLKEGTPTQMPKTGKPLRLHDLKFTTKKWSDGQIKKDLQFMLYAGVEHVPLIQVDQLVKGSGKIPRVRYEVQRDVLSNADVQHGVNVIEGVMKSITHGHFPMTDPANWCCSPTWCSVWEHCRGKK